MSIIQKAMQTAIRLTPESWLPGGTPDPLMHKHGLIGKPVSRIDGPLKVEGKARFAAEVPLDGMVYAALVYSTIARGRIATLDTTEAEAAPGVVLVMTYLKRAPHEAAAADVVGAEGSRCQRSADHAGCGDPLERPAGRAGARQDARAGGPCQVTGACHLRDARRRWSPSMRQRPHARTPDSILGEPPSIEIGDAEAALKARRVQG